VTEAERIEAEAKRLGIRRLCHLTPFRNLLHIASGDGLCSVAELEGDRAAFDPQDLQRLDQRPNHISCSIEYPNVWYLRGRKHDATPLQRLFPDWVCVLIEPDCLWREGTEFAPRNASSSHGELLRPGFDAFRGLYAERVVGAYGKTYGRERKPLACPTDDQAEVMVHKRIPLAEASTVVFADDAQARRVASALRLLRVPLEDFEFLVAQDLFETSLSEMLREGRIPPETPWTPVAPDAVG
jgi:hypothetical protein